MATIETTPQTVVPLTQEKKLAALLDATGDLDTAQVLEKTVPTWLTQAKPEMIGALDKTLREFQPCQAKVDTNLRKLQPLKLFCIEELTLALGAKWPARFDVENDHLELPAADCGCSDTPPSSGTPQAVPAATHSLLDAAMQNFTEDEAATDGFPAGSVVRVTSAPAGVAELTPQAFATFCGELDLGKRYQEHFQDVFGLTSRDGKVVATGAQVPDIKQLKRLLMLMDTHMALMKGHIEEASYKALLTMISPGTGHTQQASTLVHGAKTLIMQGIEIHNCCVWGVVVFSVRSVEEYPDEWCLVYMPGEPHRPLYEYPKFADFKQYLTLKLSVGSYKDYFAHSIDEDDKADFFATFDDTRSLGFIKQLPITTSLFDFMLQSQVGKLQVDARKLAVPTADVDEEARQKRLLKYLDLGLTLGTVAGLFVPVVGHLMMGVALGQLLAEVYDGVEDWTQGDKDEALAHLLTVGENIALMGAFAAGQKLVSKLATKVVSSHPEFFGQFLPILKPGGGLRLWKSELEPYEQSFTFDEENVADAKGLYRIGDQTYIQIDGRAYSVGFDSAAKTWHIKHPTRFGAYTPPLEHNGEGGWRQPFEATEEWTQGAYALKRINSHLAAIDDSRVEKIRKVTGTSISQLHRLSEENLPLPARLKDSIERFRLEHQLRDFVSAMERGETTGTRFVKEQLHTLPRLSGWPTDRYIKVLNEQLEITASYPKNANVEEDVLSVEVTHDQLAKGQLLDTVIAGLYSHEVDALLGVKSEKTAQSELLAKKLAEAIKADSKPLFDYLYERYDHSSVADVQKVRSVFPEIPVRLARELIDATSSVERLHLRATGRVPMGLAQHLRAASGEVRLDRALAGLYLPAIAGVDSEKLGIQFLSRLTDWDHNIRLELRENTPKGKLLESVGSDTSDTALKCIVVKSGKSYRPFGSDGKSLGSASTGPNGLFDAIITAIPPPQRLAFGFTETGDGGRLRARLLEKVIEERTEAGQFLSTGTIEPAPTDTGCTQGDSPVAATNHSKRLVRKVRKLYPLFSEITAGTFLDELGSDHLARANAVKQLQQQLTQLRTLLETWSIDEADWKDVGGERGEYLRSRSQVAEIIEDCWRRLYSVPNDGTSSLKLDGMLIGKLPILPAKISFDHVSQLSLKNMALGNDVAYFIKAFKKVESIQLDNNKLTLLPEVLSVMPGLKALSLSNNRIKLTEQTLLKLSNLRTLETLNLGYNPLGATPDVSKMFDLRFLSVRETRATELPKGLSRLPNLDRVDLRDNDIKDLPDWLFSSPRRFSETINLRHNSLSGPSLARLKEYRDSVGTGMGYLEDDITRLNEQAARSLWLPESAGETYSRRNAIWTSLKDDPQSDGLFRLLSELIHTADSEHVQEDMTRRVWRVLEAAEGNSALREQVLELAANPINCTDSAALNFSHLEVAVEIDRVNNPAGGKQSTAAPLLKLARGLFRLDQLDRIAQEHIKDNPKVDPLEVNLAYRTGLAEHFELPGQPRHMRYASLSGVTQTALDTAQARVTSAELSPKLLKFLVKQPFWTDYLKRNYPRQFVSVDETFSAKIEAVFDKVDSLTTGSYLTQLNVIKVAKEDAENAVLERLTNDALRLVDLGLCVVPGD
jgi:hypothetical protein